MGVKRKRTEDANAAEDIVSLPLYSLLFMFLFSDMLYSNVSYRLQDLAGGVVVEYPFKNPEHVAKQVAMLKAGKRKHYKNLKQIITAEHFELLKPLVPTCMCVYHHLLFLTFVAAMYFS